MPIIGRKGFSLPEVMVAMSILGGVSLVTMKLIENQMGNEAFIKANSEISRAVSLIQSAVNNPERCRQMLQGRNSTSNIQALEYISVLNGNDVKVSLLKEREPPDDTKDYGSFYLKTGDINLRPSTDFTQGSNETEVVEIVVQFRHRPLSLLSWGKRFDPATDIEILKKIPVVVSTKENVIASCGPLVSDVNDDARKKMCDSLVDAGLATWVEDDKRCNFIDTRCDPGMVPNEIRSDGGPSGCVDVKTIIGPEHLFKTGGGCQVGAAGVRLQGNGAGQFELVCPE